MTALFNEWDTSSTRSLIFLQGWLKSAKIGLSLVFEEYAIRSEAINLKPVLGGPMMAGACLLHEFSLGRSPNSEN